MYIYVYEFMANIMVHMEKVVHLPRGALIWNGQMFLPKPRKQFWSHEKPVEVECTCKENYYLERFQIPLTYIVSEIQNNETIKCHKNTLN